MLPADSSTKSLSSQSNTDRVGTSPLLPLSSGDDMHSVVATLPPLTRPAEENALQAELRSESNSYSPVGNQLSPSTVRRSELAVAQVPNHSAELTGFVPIRVPRQARGVVRDSSLLLHVVGEEEPFGVVAVDPRNDKLEFVRKTIEKHFADVIGGRPFLFVSRDGVTIRRSQEKELVAWSQAFEKVGECGGGDE